jgi:hypothetical protein
MQRYGYEQPQHDTIGDRFTRLDDMISKSKFRTIYRGLDGETGCEIAWSCYRLEYASTNRKMKLVEALRELQHLQHKYILNVMYFEVR